MKPSRSISKQEAENYINSLQLNYDQLKMLKAIHILIQIYDDNNRREMEKKFNDFETSVKKYCEELIGDHLISTDDMINKFFGIWYRKNKIPDEVHTSIEQLTQKIKCIKM